MFDPTAFENMRVVMEGIFYDKDLSGEIIILDRNDLINTAKLSRKYDLSFQLTTPPIRQVICKLSLQADLDNLTAELLPQVTSKKLAGCILTIQFTFEHFNHETLSISTEVDRVLRGIWGGKRTIKQTICSDPFTSLNKTLHTAFISFDRIITEDQMDDLSEMSDFMITTLEKLEQLATKY